MDRLTDRSKEMPTPISDHAAYYARCVNKLADYEDTGLEPEEVEACKNALMGKSLAEIKEIETIPVERIKALAKAEAGRRISHPRGGRGGIERSRRMTYYIGKQIKSMRYCADCEFNDGNVYTSLPPMYRCTITDEYHFGNYECDCDVDTHVEKSDAQPETAKRTVGKSSGGMTLWYQCGVCNEPVDAHDNFCRGCGRRLTDE